MKQNEPYPHLSDAELEEVIADWTDGKPPTSERGAREILSALVAKIADRMDLNRDHAA